MRRVAGRHGAAVGRDAVAGRSRHAGRGQALRSRARNPRAPHPISYAAVAPQLRPGSLRDICAPQTGSDAIKELRSAARVFLQI